MSDSEYSHAIDEQLLTRVVAELERRLAKGSKKVKREDGKSRSDSKKTRLLVDEATAAQVAAVANAVRQNVDEEKYHIPYDEEATLAEVAAAAAAAQAEEEQQRQRQQHQGQQQQQQQHGHHLHQQDSVHHHGHVHVHALAPIHGQSQHEHQNQQQQQQQQQYELSLQQYNSSNEYNILPEPLIDSKLKIYPVSENTITAEGNLITRPFPEQVFPNREQLNEFILDFARENGFGVVISHSNKKAIYYTCELGGTYRHKKKDRSSAGSLGSGDNGQPSSHSSGTPNPHAPPGTLPGDLYVPPPSGTFKSPVDKRGDSATIDMGGGYLLDANAKTKKLRCPFAMSATCKKSTGVWTLRTTCNEHNHPQLDPLANHPMLRKRSDELNLLILDLYKVGTKPSLIESKIKDQYPDVLIKREDIYNEIRGYKRKMKKQSRSFNKASSSVIGAQGSSGGGYEDGARKKRHTAGRYQTVIESDDESQQMQQHPLHQQGMPHQMSHADAAAAAVAAANLQYSQEELHRHLQAARMDEQYQQQQQQQYYQHSQHPGLTDNDTAAAIAAVANGSHQDLSMDNIDSRLVGE